MTADFDTDSPTKTGGKPFAVIFGATGLVGRYLAECLAGDGFEGCCLSRGTQPPPYAAPRGFYWHTVSAEEGVTAPAAATLFSLAPISALPALLTRSVGGDRLVALSTSSVIFKTNSSDPHERDVALRLRRAEEEVRRLCEHRGVAWTIFRPTLIYDPGRDGNVSTIAAFVRRFGVFPIVRPGTGRRQPIHAEDVARGMIAALRAPGARNVRFDLPGGETLTYHAMVCRIFEAVDRRPLLLPLPLPVVRLAFSAWRAVTGARYSAASLERMNQSLTLDPVPMQEALGITCRPFHPRFPETIQRADRR